MSDGLTAEVTAALNALLVDDGAAIAVTSALTGEQLFSGPLARHWRTDPQDPGQILLRPLLGPGPTFNLSVCAARPFPVSGAFVDADGLVHLAGPTLRAVVAPAAGDDLAALHAWDKFWSEKLTIEDRIALNELAPGEWYGSYGT